MRTGCVRGYGMSAIYNPLGRPAHVLRRQPTHHAAEQHLFLHMILANSEVAAL